MPHPAGHEDGSGHRLDSNHGRRCVALSAGTVRHSRPGWNCVWVTGPRAVCRANRHPGCAPAAPVRGRRHRPDQPIGTHRPAGLEPSASSSCRLERHRPPVADATLPQLFEHRSARTPMPSRWSSKTPRSATRSSIPAPTSSHITDRPGIGPETCVAHRPAAIARLRRSLLAVLKAGGAYLPLRPDYPGRRSAWSSTHSTPRLITHRVSAWHRLARAHRLLLDDLDLTAPLRGCPSDPTDATGSDPSRPAHPAMSCTPPAPPASPRASPSPIATWWSWRWRSALAGFARSNGCCCTRRQAFDAFDLRDLGAVAVGPADRGAAAGEDADRLLTRSTQSSYSMVTSVWLHLRTAQPSWCEENSAVAQVRRVIAGGEAL